MYEIILADVPWPYTPAGTAKLPYASMTWDSLRDFPWQEFCAKRCIVLSWVTGPLLARQMALHEHWAAKHGWRYLGMPWVWVKTDQAGKPLSATGPRARLVKSQAEMVVAYTTTKSGRTFPLLKENEQQWIIAPRGEHSAKPPELHDRIIGLLGDRPRLELFARTPRDGWDQIGAESKTHRIF
jgi:N6-adenosine-specific RNA methylase IME4